MLASGTTSEFFLKKSLVGSGDRFCGEKSQFWEEKKKNNPKQRDQGSFGEKFPKCRHIWRKKVSKMPRFLKDFGRFVLFSFFFWNRHI
jgi:hypothetical protein